MADPDAEARLLDGIVGKYGDDGDYADIGNDDEDALLEGVEDFDFGVGKQSTRYDNEGNGQEELDGEDILDLIMQEGELEDETDDGSGMHVTNNTYVSSTTYSDDNLHDQSNFEEHERGTNKFKNERQNPPSRSYNIPDSLDEVPVENLINDCKKRGNQRMGAYRGRFGRGGNQRNNNTQMGRTDNKTVLINPHFKGQVKISNDARLAWDARQRINQNKSRGGGYQGGKVLPFAQNNKPNQPAHNIQPWISNIDNSMAPNAAQYQSPPPALPLFQPPVFQPPSQVANWNQYPSNPPNTFNQVSSSMNMPIHQNVFMQPLSQFQAQPIPPQFTQPSAQFNSQPIFQNQNMNYHLPQQSSAFSNPQFISPPHIPQLNQFNQPNEPTFQHSGFQENHPVPNLLNQPNNSNNNNHQFRSLQLNNVQLFNGPMENQYVNNNIHPQNNSNNNNIFRNQQRFQRPKPNFNQVKVQFNQNAIIKRKIDGNMEQRKIKRILSSTNLHQVQTVDAPDTTMKDDKQPQEEDEDEETKAYRKKVEGQKRKRLILVEQKERRRRQLVLQQSKKTENNDTASTVNTFQNPSTAISTLSKFRNQPQKQQQQKNQQTIQMQIMQRTVESRTTTATTNTLLTQQLNRNIKIINTNTDESNIDKKHLTSFLSNRKILAKDQSLVDTSIVVISNLAAGTTDVQLRKMCLGIGEIKKIQMSPKERQATIQFNSVASAHAFFKKYQRTMLDLSMIQVALKLLS